ncbi:MAG: 1-deoxy-D-xylulose-5-phosphate reductoisomerase [Candidatus Omnitrophica bacterium]|nr:1-deoxy-D-xylulose-5-phosphate reductoisomerase [Candidatus Omnitrophota bacterium]
MKNIAILGSTGSIGKNALEVVRRFPGEFRVVAISANSNIDLLSRQMREFHPKLVCVIDRAASLALRSKAGRGVRVLSEEAGLLELCRDKRVDTVLVSISGSQALLPLVTAIQHGKDIALANKEALVMAGSIIMELAARKNVRIIPIDSEQSAIWQCLEGEDKSRLRKIYLTASGGPFRKTKAKDLKNISVEKVLRHPRWKMGRKITVDSATLMNKGLELLEAMFLFDVPADKIKVLVHPEAVIHSMVEFVDGVVMAQLSATDMRIPIQYALSWPRRLEHSAQYLDFARLRALHFEEPNFKKFPCLGLAYRAAREMGTYPAVLNAANEVCVEEFLKRNLGFTSIPKVVERVLDKHRFIKKPDLEGIQEADSWARRSAYRLITRMD